MQANYVRVFSSTLIGEFKFGYVESDLATLPTNYQTNAADLFGIKNSNLPDEANGQGLTTMTITSYTPLGDAGNVPLISHGRTPQYAASLTKTMGAHSFKVGGGVIMREFGVIQSQTPLGTYTFNPNLTRSTTGQGGNSVASMLLGYPSTHRAQPLAVQAGVPLERAQFLCPGRLAHQRLADAEHRPPLRRLHAVQR